MEESMSLEQFREAKRSGIDLFAEQEVKADAALTQEVPTETYDQEEVQDSTEPHDVDVESNFSEDADEPIDIPESQKTAFQKALEREKRKANEAAEKKFKEQFESEYSTKINSHQKFFDQLGMDPDSALQAIEQNRMKQEADRLAYENGWSDQQAEWYIKQQQQDKEMRDLRITVQINELEGNPNFPGIKQMKPAISEFLARNPSSNVKEGFYAVGGETMLQQIQREIEQREKAKRSTTKRTVISDVPSDMKGPAPLTDEDVTFMNRTKMSEQQLRFLKEDKGPQTLDDYRKMMKQKKG